MRKTFLSFVCLTISVVSFGQDKAASKEVATEIPPGPSMKETEAWIKREIPPLGSFSVVQVENADRSKQFTHKYGVESAVLSDCRLSLRSTEMVSEGALGELYRLTFTETATMKDIDVSKVRVLEEYVGTGYTHSRPSYAVSLISVADRGTPFTSQRKTEGFPAEDRRLTRSVRVRAGDKETANRAVEVFRRAAVLCGAPSQPVGAPVAASAQKTEIPPTKPASPTSPKMTNDEVIQLVSAGLSEPVIITSIRQAPTKDFDLTPTGLIALKKAGVPDAVIVAMQEKGTPLQSPPATEAKTPPKYDANLAEPQKPAAAPAPQNACSGIELMGLYKDDMRPALPLIMWFAKIRNGTSLTRIVTVSWTDLYGQDKSLQAEVRPGDIATLQLTRQQPVERQPINLRLSSCR